MSSNQRSSSAANAKPQTVTLWYDEEKNKHFLIDNETGDMKQVMKTGDYIRRFDVRCTGSKSYQERLEFSQNRIEYAPHIPKSLKLEPTKTYYAPSQEKFDGYAQFRCPRGNPWDNQIMVKDKKQNPETIKRWIEYGKTSLKPQSSLNSGIWDKQHDFYKHLTASVNQYDSIKSQGSDNLERELKKKKLLPPNTTILEKTISKIKEKAHEQEKDRKALENLKEQSKPLDLGVTRYNTKVTSTENKTVMFPESFRDTQNLFKTYIETKENESLNLTDLARNIDRYKTQTYTRGLTFKKSDQESNFDLKLKTETDFLNKLNREKQEMKGFVRPPEKEKNSVLTKGRFGTNIDTEGIRYKEDRKLMQTVNPDLYKVKENKSAKMRRAALDFQKGSVDQSSLAPGKEQSIVSPAL